MRVKLYGEVDENLTPQQQILKNRGIPVEEQDRWLTASPSEQYNWTDLERDKMIDICMHLKNCIENNEVVWSVKDCDADGSHSLALVYNFLYEHYPEWTSTHFKISFHTGKQHGLSDVVQEIPENTKMALIFDAGTNDINQHKELTERGIYVAIGDHHEASIDINDSPAVIINVQTCDYPNKALTGSGVAYKFICAYNDLILHGNEPTKYLDLACLGIIGDMADYKNLEIRSMVVNGLAHINNHFVKEMIKQHSYVVNKRNGLNYLSMAFAYIPFCNALDRSGTSEEKEIVFKAMLDSYANVIVPNSKRGHKGEECYLYEEAVTIADRVKRRQTNIEKQEMEICKQRIFENGLDDEPVILVQLEPDEGESSINGLVANEIQAKYEKPTIVTVRQETDKGTFWAGSMRNYSMSPIQDFKKVINDTGLAVASGHKQAAGYIIKDDDVPDFLDDMRRVYKDIDTTPIYWVEYDWTEGQAKPKPILDIAHLDIYGQGIKESQVSIKDIDLSTCKVQLLGKNRNTVKIELPSGVCIMKFQTDEEFFNSLLGDNLIMSVVGTCSDNEWQGNHTAQIIVDDYELEKGYIF